MSFYSYIINWNEVYNNVIGIESEFIKANKPFKVINSGAPHDGWENIGDIRYYRQFYYALKDFDYSYEYLAVICGDISYSNWTGFFDRVDSVLSSYDNVWLYAPHFTNDPWGKDSTSLQEMPFDKDLIISTNTNGIMFFMHRDLVKVFTEYYDFLEKEHGWTGMVSGWGIDIVYSALSIYNNKLIIRDQSHIITHPQGSSYGHDIASHETNIVFDYFNKFCQSKQYDVDRIKSISGCIYGRMSRLTECMDVNTFYNKMPNYKKKNKEINYTVIHINDERKENIDRINYIISGNNLNIKSLNAKNARELESFYKNNKEFYLSWLGFKSGEVGNFGSHYLIWKYLIESDLDSVLVFEDDSYIHDDFVYKYNQFIKDLPQDFDIFSVYVDSNQSPRFDESHRISYNLSTGYQDWSTLCYLVSKKGAQKMLDEVHTQGMYYPTDWFIFRGGHSGKFNVYTLTPEIIPPVNIDKRYESQVQ